MNSGCFGHSISPVKVNLGRRVRMWGDWTAPQGSFLLTALAWSPGCQQYVPAAKPRGPVPFGPFI